MTPAQAEAYGLFLRAYDACKALADAATRLEDRDTAAAVAWRVNTIMIQLVDLQGIVAHPLLDDIITTGGDDHGSP